MSPTPTTAELRALLEKAPTHAEAREAAGRFIAEHFGNRDDTGQAVHPRISIPANPSRDDDLRLLDYIIAIEMTLPHLLDRIDALETAMRDALEELGAGWPDYRDRVRAHLSAALGAP